MNRVVRGVVPAAGPIGFENLEPRLLMSGGAAVPYQFPRRTITPAIQAAAKHRTVRLTGNPILPRYAADPTIRAFGNRYYLYDTGFDVWSSADLTNWRYEGKALNTSRLKWGKTEDWAPNVIYHNHKFYFYFAWQRNIGVAVSRSPTGPFTDPLGKPLIPRTGSGIVGGVIDPNVFIDSTGQAYLYYATLGTQGAVTLAKLNADMTSLAGPATMVTATNYWEAPWMFERNGIYYLTYSNDYWQTANYNVQYATAPSPMGPFTWHGKLLSTDGTRVGPGSNSILNIPGTDRWYIVYHRYNTPTTDVRSTCIDQLLFNPDGTLQPVTMTDGGVPAEPLTKSGVSAR